MAARRWRAGNGSRISVHITKSHQHRRRLSAGGLALGGEGAAVAGAADESRAAGPLEGGDGVLGHSKGVGVAGILVSSPMDRS